MHRHRHINESDLWESSFTIVPSVLVVATEAKLMPLAHEPATQETAHIETVSGAFSGPSMRL